jgi:N-acetylneuraminic acid mutarotase
MFTGKNIAYMRFSELLIFLSIPVLSFVCPAQENPWTEKADMPTGRMSLSSCALDGKIYTFGGQTPGTTKAVEIYDPGNDSWTVKSELPRAVCGQASCVIGHDIFLFGGLTSTYGSAYSDAYIYHPETDTWTKIKEMPIANGYLSASVVNGKIYLIGGSSSGAITPYNMVEEYDPVTDTYTAKADMPTARCEISASVVDGKIYAIGGTTVAPWPGLSKVEVYDPAADTWATKTRMPTARWAHCAGVVNGKIEVIGGAIGELGEYIEYSVVEEYDPVTDTWITKTPMPYRRAAISSCVVDGAIYVMGGAFHQDGLHILASVEKYNPYSDVTGVHDQPVQSILPLTDALDQNYPNPFNESTKISYRLHQSHFVSLKLYNRLGQEIQTLVSEFQAGGSYSVDFNAVNLSSGIYFYRLQTGDHAVEIRKMILLR